MKNSQINLPTALLSAALAYAEQGLYIIPLHEPLFNDAGALTGCTCESYKRSAKYKAWLASKGLPNKFDPNFKCRTPGKHPRLSEWETNASKDPEQIRAWWHKWPTANIGLAVGKSGLITFDRDTYKEIYGDDSDLFTQEDKQTATQISGGGGEHLVFQMPVGKAYTNANNTLPPGIDIRGIGGMQVVAPSIHPSGNVYQWEEGYNILECAPKPLPLAFQSILDAAHTKRTPENAVTFTTATTERPTLIRWQIGTTIRALIHNPPPAGQRSEADFSVCLSLIYAGATNDDILAVFEHYPIGTQGKFAERGPSYLARTIGRARGRAEANPRPDVAATIAQIQLSIKTHNLTDHITAGPGSKKVRLVADAACVLMREDQKLTVTAGKKRLAKYAGVSPNTVVHALQRLHGVLFDITPTEFGYRITLVDFCRLQKFDPSLSSSLCVNTGGQKIENDKNEYSIHKVDDAFLTGTSRYIRRRIQALAQTLEITPTQAKKEYTFSGLGEGVLLAYDTWVRCGDMTAQQYAGETGLKLAAARTHLRRAAAMGLAEAEREGSRGPKVYSFVPDFYAKIDELAPNLRTHRLSDQRENKRIEAAQQWAKHAADIAATQEEKQAQERRFAKLARQRLPHLTNLHPNLSVTDIERLAYDVAAYKRPPQIEQAIRTKRKAQRAEHRETVALIADLAQSIADVGTPRENVFDEVMKYGVFDPLMVRSVLQSPAQMANYETLEDIRRRMHHADMTTTRVTNSATLPPQHQLALDRVL